MISKANTRRGVGDADGKGKETRKGVLEGAPEGTGAQGPEAL